jgi:alcohol dehydrogenase class IV
MTASRHVVLQNAFPRFAWERLLDVLICLGSTSSLTVAKSIAVMSMTYDPIGSFWHYTPFRLGEYPDGGKDGTYHGPEDAAVRA